jgi:hypothetical protein
MNQFPTTPLARRTGLALLLVLALGAFLRFHGIGFLLPCQTEPDAVVYTGQVRVFQEGKSDAETKFLYGFYPHVVSRLAVGLMPPRAYAEPAQNLAEHTRRAVEPRRRIRMTVALLSLLAIPAVWWFARRIADPAFALGAAVFMAASFLTLWFAQQARPHAASSAFAALAVAAAVHLRAAGGWRAYVCAGLAAGLAIGSLQSGLAVLPALGVAVLLRAWSKDETRGSVAIGTLVAVALIAVQVVMFYPFVFASGQPGEIGKSESMLHVSGHLIDLKLFNGAGLPIVARTLWQYDPLLCVLSVLGILIGVWELWSLRSSLSRVARDQVLVVLAFVVPYAIVICLYERTYQRFVLPLVPFQCVLAGYALCRVVAFSARFGCLANRAAAVCAGLVVALQVFGAWQLAHARSQPSTIDEAARWIEGHVPRDARVTFLPLIELPLLPTRAAREESKRAQNDVSFMWFRYLMSLAPAELDGDSWNIYAMNLTQLTTRDEARGDPMTFLRSTGADFVVLPLAADPRRLLPRALRHGASQIGTRVARFSPDRVDDGVDIEFSYQDDDNSVTSNWFLRGANLRCAGPVVEIYDVRGGR